MRSADAASDVLQHVGNSPSAECRIKPVHRKGTSRGSFTMEGFYIQFLLCHSETSSLVPLS